MTLLRRDELKPIAERILREAQAALRTPRGLQHVFFWFEGGVQIRWVCVPRLSVATELSGHAIINAADIPGGPAARTAYLAGMIDAAKRSMLAR